jgi:GNAT superfamily N-acetyltransferase
MAAMSDPESLLISVEPVDSVDARRLVAELDSYLTDLYPPDENFTELPAEDTTAGRGAFLVLRLSGEAVACGAVRLLSPSVAEIKRMYVVPSARRRGLSRALLAELETQARRLGPTSIIVETGVRQAEALRLYESAGYARIPCFGEYAASRSSICFEKPLE